MKKKMLSVVLMMLFVGIAASQGFALNVPSQTVIGETTVGTWDGNTYTLLVDITESIVIEESNMILDGNGCSVTGSGEGSGNGVEVDGKRNVALKNLNITNFDNGIYMIDCNKCRVLYNTTSYNIKKGILLTSLKKSEDNVFVGNTISYNCLDEEPGQYDYDAGLHLGRSSESIIFNNKFIGNIQGGEIKHTSATTTYNNIYSLDIPVGGNYWDDCIGDDTDDDGLIDFEPGGYYSTGTGSDYHPMVDEYSRPTIDSIIGFFDVGVDERTITARGNAADERLEAFRNILVSAQTNINLGLIDDACDDLATALTECDGENPDLIAGVDVVTLYAMIEELMAALGC